jgi:hypothetical protein
MQMKYTNTNEEAAKIDDLQKRLEESIHEIGSTFG